MKLGKAPRQVELTAGESVDVHGKLIDLLNNVIQEEWNIGIGPIYKREDGKDCGKTNRDNTESIPYKL